MIVDGRPVITRPDFPQPGPAPADVGFLDALAPAFRTDNIVGSTAMRLMEPSPAQDSPLVNAFDEIAGTEYEEYADSFLDAYTAAQVQTVKDRIDRENADRRVLEEAGVGGVLASMAAGVIDIPTLLPLGALAGGARAGVTAGRLAARTAAVAGAEATVVEGILQAQQETRTAAESATVIGGSVLLGGLLGGVAGAALSRSAEGAVAFREAARAVDASVAQPLGAAARVRPELTDFALPTRAAEAIRENTPGGLSFTDRLAKAQSPVARQYGDQLIANEYAYSGTDRLDIQPSVERIVDVQVDRYSAMIAQTFRDDYAALRKAGGDLTRGEFAERVAMAMRRADDDPLPEVAAAAKRLRAQVVEPLKEQAIKLGKLPEDVKPTTAASYLTRMWDQNRIVARSDEFIARLAEKFSRDIGRVDASVEARAQRDLSAAMNDLRNMTEARGGKYDDLSSFIEQQEPLKKRRASLAREAKGIRRRPAIELLRKYGVHPDGPFAAELRHMGVNNKTVPGLFSRKGRKDFDNIGDDPFGVGLDGLVRLADDGTYIDRASLLERVFEEMRPNPRMRAADQHVLEEISAIDELMAAGRASVKEAGREGELQRIRELAAKIEGLSERARDAEARASMTPDEIKTYARAAAEDVYDTLTNAPSATDTFNIVAKARGPLKDRTLSVQDVDFEDFLINDAEFVLGRYSRIMTAENELTRRFGSADLTDQIAEIKADYAARRDAATTEKQRVALDAEMRRVIKSFEAARDMVRGTYQQQARSSTPYRVMQGAMTYNYVRALGDVVASSLPDLFKITMANGLMPVARDALVPMVRNLKGLRVAQKEAAAWAGIAEPLLNSRMMRLADVTDPMSNRSPVENALQWMGNKASLFSGMMHWNQFLKENVTYLANARMLRMAEKGLAQRDGRFLQRLKINSANWAEIKDQLAQHATRIDGVVDPGLENWPEDIRKVYTAALRGEADTVIVTPGIGDRIPAVEEYWALKAAAQFKSFALASQRKTLMVGLQEDQARFVQNALLMASMGMFVYWLKSLSRESGADDNPGTWLAEGIDRAGVLPLVMEMNNMAERVGAPGVYYGLGAMLGDNPRRATRYQVRGTAESLLGPSFGLATDAITTAAAPLHVAFGDGEITKGDVGAARRLVPFGNHPGIKQFLNLYVVPELKEAVE